MALGALHLRHRPATVCVLRATTGIPCPFCGGTTAAVKLGRGDVRGAVAASPLAIVMLVAWPWLGTARGPRWWVSRRVRWPVVLAVLGLAELWQLARFGFIG